MNGRFIPSTSASAHRRKRCRQSEPNWANPRPQEQIPDTLAANRRTILTIGGGLFAVSTIGFLRVRDIWRAGFYAGEAALRFRDREALSMPSRVFVFIQPFPEAAHGYPLRFVAPDPAVCRRRVYRQLHHAHGTHLSPQRLPPAPRGRQSAGHFARRRFAARLLHVSVQ